VAKSVEFVTMVNDMAAAVAKDGEAAIEAFTPAVEQMLISLKENISVGKVVRFEVSAEQNADAYLHSQDGRGVNAVLVVLNAGSDDLAHDVAVHAAFTKPQYLSRDEVPQADVDAERETVENIARNEGKPEAALEKVVEGRLNGWYKERVLVDQAFVKDEKKTIAQLLNGATVTEFAQVVVGD
jgi:elongation factor Ts